MFLFKYSNSIISFGLKFLILISGLLLKLFFSDVIFADEGNILNYSKDQDSDSDQSLSNKIKNLPWGLILYIGLLSVFAYYSYSSLYPEDSTIKNLIENLAAEYSAECEEIKKNFATAPDTFKFFLFLEKEAKYWAFKQGLTEGTPECKEFINKFIRDHSEKLSEDVKSTIVSLLN